MSNIAIYVATHKEFNPPCSDIFIPIEVGASRRTNHFGYIRDDSIKDNISHKNNTYCELTALYWVWKSNKWSSSDIVGLCHYRRYFSSHRIDSSEEFYLNRSSIETILENHDMILPEKWYWKHHTVAQGYCDGDAYEKDLNILSEVILNDYTEYYKSFQSIMSDNEASYCNMFITRKEIMDDYCKWLFSVLKSVEDKVDISTYSKEEQRIYGYMSELLLNVYVDKNKLNVYYTPIVLVEKMNFKHKLLFYLEKIPGVKYFTKAILCKDAHI